LVVVSLKSLENGAKVLADPIQDMENGKKILSEKSC
jgi:hypothetical protein